MTDNTQPDLDAIARRNRHRIGDYSPTFLALPKGVKDDMAALAKSNDRRLVQEIVCALRHWLGRARRSAAAQKGGTDGQT